jgi:hypothetical protein
VHERTAAIHQVSGAVVFGWYKGTPPSSVNMRVRWNGFLFGYYDVPVAAGGSFSLALPAGALELSTKPTHWLRMTLPANTSGGDFSGMDFELANGDANGDNHVGFLDLAFVLQNWKTNDPASDLDGNGTVGFGDLSASLVNFGMKGDT